MSDPFDDPGRVLRAFADREAEPGGAPLYAAIARAAASDPSLLALLAEAPDAQRRGTLFFAAAHDLMQRAGDAWPTIAASEDPPQAFRDFVLDHAADMRTILATRKTQTNEVARSAVLRLALLDLDGPLALVEPGASAGLNLNLDRYRYAYGAHDAEGAIWCEDRARTVPSGDPPEIIWRRGIYLDPIDLQDDDQVAWLRACVWAEHPKRRRALDHALAIARRHPPVVDAGDATQILRDTLANAPRTARLCVMNSALMPYLSAEEAARFLADLRDHSAERDVTWISFEGWMVAERLDFDLPPREPSEDFSMALTRVVFRDGAVAAKDVLAYAAPHGSWVRLCGPRR